MKKKLCLSCIFANGTSPCLRPSVAKSTWLPSLSTDRHLVYPLKTSFALRKGDDL